MHGLDTVKVTMANETGIVNMCFLNQYMFSGKAVYLAIEKHFSRF